MTSYSALSPVSAGVYTVLNVAALTTLAPGGVGDDIAQGTGYPFVLYEVHERALGGFGTKPGLSQLPEIDLRVHVFSTYQGWSEAQAVMSQVIALLTANPPTVTGYGSWAIFHDETIALADQVIAGVKVKELVAIFRLYVEAGASGSGSWTQSGWTQA
jgi:hypothetical protein